MSFGNHVSPACSLECCSLGWAGACPTGRSDVAHRYEGVEKGGADLIRLQYAGFWPIASRDLCLLRGWGQDADGGAWLTAESVEDGLIPPDSEEKVSLRMRGRF